MKTIHILFTILIIPFISIYGQDNLFPQINGWKLEIEKQVYDAGNLWNIIDGAADLFLEYSFIDMHSARYSNASGIEIKVELYRHSSPNTAFGMYSQEKDPDYSFLKIGAQGYIEPGALNFLSGVYYAKLSCNQNGDEVQNSLKLIAGKTADNLKQDNTLPAVLNAFPEQWKKQNTEQYVAQNFLGYSFLKSAFTTSYINNSFFKIFIIENENPETAKAVLDKYVQTISRERAIITGNKYELNDPNNGMIILLLQGKYLFGTVNCTDKSTIDGLIKKIAARLSE